MFKIMALSLFIGVGASSLRSQEAAPKTPKADPVLIKATFSSHTTNEDKDHDTGVYVKVWTEDKSSLIAHADNRDNSGDDGTQYKDYSDHEFGLDVDAAGVEKSTAKKFKVQVCIHTHGNDTWRMSSRVVLQFSDKTNLTAGSGTVELKNDGACTEYSA